MLVGNAQHHFLAALKTSTGYFAPRRSRIASSGSPDSSLMASSTRLYACTARKPFRLANMLAST